MSAGSYSYEYGANGNQIRKKWSLNGQEQQTAEYVYDGLGRLTREKRGEETISYGYDAAGNRKQMSVMGTDSPFVTDYTYDKNNRLLSETKALTGQTELTEYQYDPNGNLISKMGSRTASPTGQAGVTLSAEESGVQTGLYGYNGFNQLTELMENGRTASYTYDANGLRTSKTVDGVTTGHIWDGMNLVAETDSKGAVTGKYYRGLGLVYGEQAGQTQYYSMNAHGDVDMLSDASGNVIKTYEYDAFGVERNRDEADANPFRYAGEYYDGETDSIYLRARYYMPSMGRFTTEDPIRDGLNWYSYCSGNPVMFIDPSGYLNTGYDENGVWHDWDAEAYGKDSDTYKILQNLTDGYNAATDELMKWFYAGVAEDIRNDYSNGFEYKYLGDEELNRFLYNNAINLRDYVQKYGQEAAWLYFVNLVKPGGEWDFKTKGQWRWPYTVDVDWSPMEDWQRNTKKWIWSPMLGGMISAADLGNLNYGYTIIELGVSKEVAQSGAGALQILQGRSHWEWLAHYFDDPEDNAFVYTGLDMR